MSSLLHRWGIPKYSRMTLQTDKKTFSWKTAAINSTLQHVNPLGKCSMEQKISKADRVLTGPLTSVTSSSVQWDEWNGKGYADWHPRPRNQSNCFESNVLLCCDPWRGMLWSSQSTVVSAVLLLICHGQIVLAWHQHHTLDIAETDKLGTDMECELLTQTHDKRKRVVSQWVTKPLVMNIMSGHECTPDQNCGVGVTE